MTVLVYPEGDSLYVNLTNRCPVACGFCVKTDWDWDFKGYDLKLPDGEPSAAQAVAALEARLAERGDWKEVVFCGFGESTYRLPELLEIARHVKSRRPGPRVRLNTVGLGSLIWGRDIVPELAPALDAVSVSLNTADPAQWVELHRARGTFRERGFEASRLFAQGCAAAGIDTRVTALPLEGVDVEAVRAYARGIGASFLVRPLL